MKGEKWLLKNGRSLDGKTVVITGATGGLGSALCRYVLALHGRLILVNRSREKAEALKKALLSEFSGASVELLYADLEEISQVREVSQQLQHRPVDILVLNAGTYAIPRATCSTGWDNVFQTNFLSHYYLARTLLPLLEQRKGRIVATGSIAHRFNVTDPADRDFAGRTNPNHIYGNSKRYLMFSLMELVKTAPDVQLSIAHPGICFTNITSHYPKNILPIVRCSMKVLFMHPPKASRGLVLALGDRTPEMCWIGPKFRDIWGNPVRKPLSCPAEERQRIFADAEEMYQGILSAESPSGSTAADDPAAPTAAAAENSD